MKQRSSTWKGALCRGWSERIILSTTAEPAQERPQHVAVKKATMLCCRAHLSLRERHQEIDVVLQRRLLVRLVGLVWLTAFVLPRVKWLSTVGQLQLLLSPEIGCGCEWSKLSALGTPIRAVQELTFINFLRFLYCFLRCCHSFCHLLAVGCC
jgi:hypothetical protein